MKKKTFKLALCCLCFWLLGTAWVSAQNLQLHYTFQNLSADKTQLIDESGNAQTATLFNGASVRTMGTYKVLDLGSSNGYLNLGADAGKLIQTLSDFSIALNLCIDNSTDLTAAGNFIWSFANSDNMASDMNGNMFLTAISTRYAITKTYYPSETALSYATAFPKGTWKQVTYSQSGSSGTIYVDGLAVKTGTVTLQPSALGATTCNYIGKSSYSSDAYLKKTLIYDFRIYNKALNSQEVSGLSNQLTALNAALTLEQLSSASSDLSLGDLSAVVDNLTLPTSTTNSIAITWTSSNSTCLSATGKITRPAIGTEPMTVSLTATLSKNGQSVSKIFWVTIPPFYSDIVSVSKDLAAISLSGNLTNLRTNLTLPSKGIEGSSIVWTSDNTSFLSSDGTLLKLSPKGSGKQKVTLTALLSKGFAVSAQNFDIYIAEDEGLAAYLFVYFTGNSTGQEAIRFALSNDGYTYRALNNNNPVLSSASISSSGGVRDPHILRGEDGKFYMVATDMNVAANGWSVADKSIILLKSSDLINWTSSVVDVSAKFSQFASINRAWAPQTIWDKDQQKYMVYFSMRIGTGIDIIYYSYANSAFTDLETVPQQLFYSPTSTSCIDADIIYKDGQYNMFFKTEASGNGIKKAVSNKINQNYVIYDKYLQQTTNAVEGAGVFRLINSDTYILMYDMYTSGAYQFTKSTDLMNFSLIDNQISMNFTPRHGTVMTITEAEAQALAKKWGTSSDLVVLSAEASAVKKTNVVIDNTANTVYVPVKNGTALTAFNPKLTSLAGAIITPAGEQDFSKGAVTYSITIDGIGTKTYQVSVKNDNNPILDAGYFADPEILYSHQTGKYYIYPTSDGFTSWSGTYFKTFSSKNLVDWTDEGVILNLPTEVSWATTNAWAPTIKEKLINGKYYYFYYFCAGGKIGVATADSPTGKFIDSGSALIANLPTGVSSGQQIDPDVFTDPKTGKNYLYWGNGYLACAELNEDMISINTSTIKIMTPNSTFREGVEVFYRKGLYYILWSENDTRSEDYRVRYATATSPQGALTIPSNNLVIAKDATRGIYATGHNCVLNVEGTDSWYIVYHRFTRPKGISLGTAAGYYREVCMDTLTFNTNGTIQQVQATLEGIRPYASIDVTTSIDTTTPIVSTTIQSQTAANSIRIYPNPVQEEVNLSIEEREFVGGTLEIYDLLGRIQIQQSITQAQTSIAIPKTMKGVYILKYIKNKIELRTCSIVVL